MAPAAPDPRPIALLDSGVGGLSILREVRRQLPQEDLIYFADQAHVPYGPRSKDELRVITGGIVRFFLAKQAKLIVVACNAASAAALYTLRQTFPDMPFVGMEPAVKPAALNTHTGVIGVITTQATYQGELFASVIDRFAENVEVVTQVCPELVTLVEAGDLDTPAAFAYTERYLAPLLDIGIDQLVLGCTHFPFLADTLQAVAGPDVTIVDPSAAVAKQARRVIAEGLNSPAHSGSVQYYTSGSVEAFRQVAGRLLVEPLPAAAVHAATWHDGELVATG